jgi:hypothetical protein
LKGWIKVHRNILRKDWFKNHKVVKLWLYCQLKATHEPFRATVRFQSVPLQPGQFIFGRKKAAEETGLSEREIRTCLDFLVKEGALIIKPTTKFSIITVVNWAKYQGTLPQSDQQQAQEATNKRPHTIRRRKKRKRIRDNKIFRSAPGAQGGEILLLLGPGLPEEIRVTVQGGSRGGQSPG